LPSPIHHGLHSDAEDAPRRCPHTGCHPLFITGCIRTNDGTQTDEGIEHCCHPLFITGCIRTWMLETGRIWSCRCHPLFITGCIRTLYNEVIRERLKVAIPYSSRVAFGHMTFYCMNCGHEGCHPLFITGCIRTLRDPILYNRARNVAIPYSSRVAFGPIFSEYMSLCRRLPSPIHHGLHSDREKLKKFQSVNRVAIPYSSRVAFGLQQEALNRCLLLWLPSPIHHGLHSDKYNSRK